MNKTVAWLSLIQDELSMIDLKDSKEPLYTDDPGDTLLGVLESDEARRVWVLWENRKERLDRRTTDAKYARTNAERERIVHECVGIHREAEIIGRIFWLLVCTEFPQGDDPSYAIGIRHGWRIVKQADNGGDALKDLLNRLAGK